MGPGLRNANVTVGDLFGVYLVFGISALLSVVSFLQQHGLSAAPLSARACAVAVSLAGLFVLPVALLEQGSSCGVLLARDGEVQSSQGLRTLKIQVLKS